MLGHAVLFALGALGVFAFSSLVIREASKVAEMLGRSLAAVGFLLLAVSTSLPELLVNVFTAAEGQVMVGIGNVIGSNIANICLVFGIAAVIARVRVPYESLVTNAEILLFISVAPLTLLPVQSSVLATGIVLLSAFNVYVYYILSREKKTAVYYLHVPEGDMREVHVRERAELAPVALFLVGVAGTVLSSRILVDHGLAIVQELGVLPSFFGATAIAVSTSLPEIVIDTRAIRRGMTSLAVGDILGSCVVNMSLVLGVSLLIGKSVQGAILTPLLVMSMVPPVILWYSLVKHEGVPRNVGLVLLGYYALFLARQFSWA